MAQTARRRMLITQLAKSDMPLLLLLLLLLLPLLLLLLKPLLLLLLTSQMATLGLTQRLRATAHARRGPQGP